MDKTHQTHSWETFWKENPVGFNSTMAQSTLFFARNLIQTMPIDQGDHVLDIGCGPGFLIDYLIGKCELIHGTDISESYISICREKYTQNPEVSLSVTKAYDYRAYQELITEKKITKVVLLSILQYYRNEQEVANLILSLKEISGKQKLSCLLADIIPVKHSTLDDIFSIIRHALKKGYTLKFIKFLTYAVLSDYRKVKKNGLLQVDESFFRKLAEEHHLDIQIIKNLTLHTSRYSVLITF